MRFPRWMLIKSWQEQEKDTAKKYKGRRQAQSGAQDGFKEDVMADKYLIQDKFTTKKSISIKLIDWKNLIKNAGTRQIPIMRINFSSFPLSFIMMIEEENIEEEKDEEKNNK